MIDVLKVLEMGYLLLSFLCCLINTAYSVNDTALARIVEITKLTLVVKDFEA